MAVRVASYSRVARELEAAKDAENPVLNLNYCCLREIPEPLLRSKHCRNHLRKLYLKKNLIASLVCVCVVCSTSMGMGGLAPPSFQSLL